MPPRCGRLLPVLPLRQLMPLLVLPASEPASERGESGASPSPPAGGSPSAPRCRFLRSTSPGCSSRSWQGKQPCRGGGVGQAQPRRPPARAQHAPAASARCAARPLLRFSQPGNTHPAPRRNRITAGKCGHSVSPNPPPPSAERRPHGARRACGAARALSRAAAPRPPAAPPPPPAALCPIKTSEVAGSAAKKKRRALHTPTTSCRRALLEHASNKA